MKAAISDWWPHLRRRSAPQKTTSENPPPFRPSTTRAAGPFDDVPLGEWSYEALSYLNKRGMFTGYPDGTFKGKRALTRYEFAAALQRLLTEVSRLVGDDFAGDPIPTIGDIEAIVKLVSDFTPELAMLGADVEQITSRLVVTRETIRRQ